MSFRRCVGVFVWVLAFALAATSAAGQANTAQLSGVVLDPSGAAIAGAKVTVKNLATGATRSADSGADGRYLLVNLPPGRYELAVEAAGMAKWVTPEIILTIGQSAEFDVAMRIKAGQDVITVDATTEVIETSKTAVADTVDLRRITNLPINGRNYINFTLTSSQAQRDSAPSIGAAPTSGINFSGQRARSNQVSVDGADAVDNSVNAVRATVPQEAVQEFQLIISNYSAEFGRATGGVINIVTKSGSNELHGNAFGYIRHKDIQARNPFSVEVDPGTGAVTAVKQAYTRALAGISIGGPIQQDKTFYFLSYELTRRQESGFTNIGAGNFGFVTTTTPAALLAVIPNLPPTLQLTPAQATFINDTAQAAAVRAAYAALAGSGSSVGLTGTDPGAVALAQSGGAVLLPPGGRFPLLIDCLPPAIPCAAANAVTLPTSFVPLRNLIGNYPIKESTDQYSLRLDHRWSEDNTSFLRFSVTPSYVTGIQVNAQNQNFGQNAGTRTSIQQTRDMAIVGQHTTVWSPTWVTEARFQFARRGLGYRFSNFTGGDQVAVNIPGFAFFGREPFSTVDRIERRWQWTVNQGWIWNKHNFKFGADINLIQLRSGRDQIFELNFGGLFNFGGLTASTFAAFGIPATAPGFTAVQAYGLGIPQVFVQGIGRSDRPFNNYAYGFYFQDSWKLNQHFTLNYGVRYDYEHTPLFSAATALNAAAESAFGVVEGIPHDTDNVAPRIGLAWDPTGKGNTVIHAGYGIFYDHPLLAVAFNSVTAEGALSTQLISAGGTATGVPITPASVATALNAASIFQGVLGRLAAGPPANFGYLPSQQRFDPKLSGSIFADQNFMTQGFPIPILPFTLHVDGGFEYAYSQQGNVTWEQKLGNDYKLSWGYTYTHGLHLNRPRNITPTDAGRLSRNFRNALAGGLTPSSPLAVSPVTRASTATTCAILSALPGPQPPAGTAVPLGVLGSCPASGPNSTFNGQFLGAPAFFNFFRPTGPNPSFAAVVPGGYATQVALATAAGYPTGISGVQVPWSDIMQQEASGKSIYHGMTVTFSKRFSQHFEFFSSWTWSHAQDDSTDLQTLLAPQNNNRPDLEWSDSTFDQRHRYVFSAVFESPYKQSDEGFLRKLFAHWVFAPIFEAAAGRPFTVLTGSDFNLDFGSNTDRPSHVAAGGVPSFFLPEANTFSVPTVCPTDPITGNATNTIYAGLPAGTPSFFGCTGNMGRNAFVRPSFISFDMRLSRGIPIGERWRLDLMMDIFNLANRFNVGDVSPLCNPLDAAACRAGEPTAALDPRQFQFGIKLSW
jgi:hypothetical protein